MSGAFNNYYVRQSDAWTKDRFESVDVRMRCFDIHSTQRAWSNIFVSDLLSSHSMESSLQSERFEKIYT